MKELSSYLKNMPVSSIRKLVKYANKTDKKGIKVYHLNIGQPDIPTPKSYFEAIKNFDEKVDSYMPSEGINELRKEYTKYLEQFDVKVNKDDCIITTGGTEGFTFSLLALTNSGDEVLVFEPYYSNYNTVFAMADINPCAVTTHVENNFHFTKSDIEKRITNKTKVLLVTNPGNPTGTVLTKNEIKAIEEVVIEHDLYLIADEVYREIVFDKRKPYSFLSNKKLLNRLIVIDSISKKFSACGSRIGMVVTKNKNIRGLIYKLALSRLSVSTLEQKAAVALFKYEKDVPNKIREMFEKRRDVVISILKKEKLLFRIPEGAFYLILKLPVKNAEDFLIYMLEKFSYNNETVMASSAEGFYATKGLGKDEIRIAFVLNEEEMKKSVKLLLRGLKAYRNNNE